MVIDIKSEVLFQFLVDPLGLTICLWVISCGWVVLYTQGFEEICRKFGLKLSASIMDDLIRSSM